LEETLLNQSKTIQEQQKIIDELKSEIEAMKLEEESVKRNPAHSGKGRIYFKARRTFWLFSPYES